jgi:alpha-L-fucosidase
MKPATGLVFFVIAVQVCAGVAHAKGRTGQVTASPSGTQPSSARPPGTGGLTAEQQDAAWQSRGCVDDERGRWFRDAKFGAFIHFGLYSHLGGFYDGKGPYRPAEQIIGLGDRHAAIPAAEYKARVGAAFNPAKFDAARWVGLMKKAGQKYVILTTKHHDGFCMFKTATTPYNVVESTPFARDVVKELADECRRQGLVFCVYYSIGDWCAADVQNPGFASYKDYMYAQLKELLTSYGDIKMLWLDNYWYVNDQWKSDTAHAKDLYAYARSINPSLLVNDRCGQGAESTDGDYATPENQLKGSLQSRYFEVVMTNTADDNWGWVKTATNYRKPAELIRNLIDSASKGGNFVLNVGPNADGEFPPEHVAILEAIGAWTSVNGEAIYGTVPAPEVSPENTGGSTWYATKSKDGAAVYVHVIKWPSSGEPLNLRIDRAGYVTAALLDPSLGEVRCGAAPSAAGASGHGSTTLSINPPVKLDPCATVVKLTFGQSPGT